VDGMGWDGGRQIDIRASILGCEDEVSEGND
jgi:hypothetical protein